MSMTEDGYSNIPDSPLHPEADVEAKIPEQAPDSKELDFLDLNPDIDDADDTTTPSNNGDSQNKQEGFQLKFEPMIIPSPSISSNPAIKPRRLSAVQQTKFNGYVEEQLHHIQRNFIQSLGLGENGYNDLSSLLSDVKSVINFIWLSIDPNSSSSHNSSESIKSTLFGQTSYLISIANDLLDYLVKFKLTRDSAIQLLKILQSLDSKFSKLIDGDIPGGTKLLQTEKVRINGIAERSRVFVASYFEKNGIDEFHYEISTVYEGVLERTG